MRAASRWARRGGCARATTLAILAVGSEVYPALAAADILERRGLSAEVIDMRFIKPLDEDLLTDVWARHRLVITVEENALAGGFGVRGAGVGRGRSR